MADISILSRLINGIQRNVNLSSNSLKVLSLKVGSSELELKETTGAFDFSGINLTNVGTVDGRDVSADGSALDSHLDGGSSKHDASEIDVEAADGKNHSQTDLESVIGELDDAIGELNFVPSNYANPAADIVADHLSAIDTALGTALSTEFADDVFRITDNGDSSKKIAFEASAITTATVRTITMPDTNVDLGQIATNKTHVDGDGSDHQDVADHTTLSGSAANSTNHGAFTGEILSDTETTRSALQALETAVEANAAVTAGLEWQDSALDFVTDNTAVPASENSGDRFILSDAGGAPNAAWDGASAGDIVEFDGSVWVALTPTTGMFISADDEDTLLYYWGGSSWVQKAFEATTASTGLTKSGFDIRLADAAENASGIKVLSGVITLEDLGAFDTDDLAEGSALYFTEARVRATVLTGIDVSTNGSVAAGSSILVALGFLQANQADLTTLSGVAQGAVDLGTFSGSTIADAQTVKQALQALETAHEAHVNDSADAHDASAIGYTPDTLADWDSSSDPGETDDALDQLASRVKSVEADNDSSLVEGDMVAGESFAANTSFLVRMAINGETAGRIYKADKAAGAEGAETDTIYVIGLAQNRTGSLISAAANIPVVKLGAAVLQSSDGTFTASQDEGLPVYLNAAGAFTLTPPSSTNDAVAHVGNVKDVGGSSAIEIKNSQIMGINA